MARLMDGKGLHPRYRFLPVRLLDGEKIHALRSPCHRPVGARVERVENDVGFGLVGLSGGHSEAKTDDGADKFQPTVDGRQRIEAFGIYQTVVLSFAGPPAYRRRIFTVGVKLRRRRQGRQQHQHEYDRSPFHLTSGQSISIASTSAIPSPKTALYGPTGAHLYGRHRPG